MLINLLTPRNCHGRWAKIRVGCVACCACLAGCGSDGGLVPVSGRVTLDGRPLADVMVVYQPLRNDARNAEASTAASIGTTDVQGRYTLRKLDARTLGAAVGQHKVYIGTNGIAPSDVAPVSLRKLPASCTNGSLGFEVPVAGTLQANFDLKSTEN